MKNSRHIPLPVFFSDFRTLDGTDIELSSPWDHPAFLKHRNNWYTRYNSETHGQLIHKVHFWNTGTIDTQGTFLKHRDNWYTRYISETHYGQLIHKTHNFWNTWTTDYQQIHKVHFWNTYTLTTSRDRKYISETRTQLTTSRYTKYISATHLTIDYQQIHKVYFRNTSVQHTW